MGRFQSIKKVLILGSGAIKIGEAGEFDYSGSQCIKALKEEGIETVLVNPNIATIQTDKKLADKTYFLPIKTKYVAEVIEKERPDGILLGFGGQIALNCGVELKKKGILDEYGVKVLGTSVESIEIASDREKFRRAMIDAGLPVARSKSAYSLEEAKKCAEELGYPVMVRVAFTLGGKGGGIANNEAELMEIVERGLAHSLIREVLIEEYLGELKQIEYEVMRDYYGNSITVCNMENILGMRVHTGDNIVVAPSQTLTNYEYHMLRDASIKVVQTIQVVGECNVQFALDSNTGKYYIIEINPRMSRSSALASKATGYPIAYMAAKLAIGYSLSELLNKITKITTAAFEPSLDYVVIKIPRWDFNKFPRVDRRLRTQMKSVGEVMAIGRKFEEALQKAIRMLDIGKDGLTVVDGADMATIEDNLVNPTDEILFYVASAIKKGLPIEKISKLSRIDPWFLYKIKNIVDTEEELKKANVNDIKDLKEKLLKAKRLGFSDKQIARCLNLSEDEVRILRKSFGIIPYIKQIDSLAAEWPAKTNYLYMTYNASSDDIDLTKNGKRVIVLGSGPYRIGVSVEFDWATVNMAWSLKNLGIEDVIIINCNPETVSTDYDVADKLYFEELNLERVLDIYEKENADGIIVSVGGQVANNLVPKLAKHQVKIFGSGYESIEAAENRKKFSELLDSLGIKQPPWDSFTSLEGIMNFAYKVGFPLIIRPSFVIGGSSMEVVWTPSQLKRYIEKATKISPEYPVTVSKFILGAKEVEVDAVADEEKVIIGAIIEHIENAGVHSGDAVMVIPPITLSDKIQEEISRISEKIAKALKIIGLFNIQFLVKGEDIYVIECNLRASRSMPFTSKATGVNLIELAAEAMIRGRIDKPFKNNFTEEFAVKIPQFSFMQLDKADPILTVEMRSTGEVACFGETFFEAFLKALEASGLEISLRGNVFVSAGGIEYKEKLLPIVMKLKELGYEIYATEHTAEFLRKKGIEVKTLYKIREERKPNIIDYLREGKLNLIINIPSSITLEKYSEMLEDEYLIRRKAVEMNVPLITRIETVSALVEALEFLIKKKQSPLIGG